MTISKIHFLCSGTPTPDARSFGSSVLLELGDSKILVDCGPAATRTLANTGFSPLDLDAVFLTHLHFDHCVDMPCLLLSHWDQNADSSRDLPVFGPNPTAEFVDSIIGFNGAFKADIDSRINAPISQMVFANRGGSLPRPKPSFSVRELDDGDSVKIQDVQVKVKTVEHVQPHLLSLAYRFELNSKSVVLAGDTGSLDTVGELADACDVLVVNCWNATADIRGNSGDDFLATPERAAEMAAMAGAKKLCLSHLGYRSGQNGSLSNKEMTLEVRKHFQGEFEIINEGDVVNV